MDIAGEIATRVNKLSPDMQKRVLQYVASLPLPLPKGENGVALRQFSGLLDATSAEEMIRAIEEECERVDAAEW